MNKSKYKSVNTKADGNIFQKKDKSDSSSCKIRRKFRRCRNVEMNGQQAYDYLEHRPIL